MGEAMAEYGGQEGLPAELVHGRGGVRDHGRGARDGMQQGDLSHTLAAAAPPQDNPVLDGVKLPCRDGVVGISRVALPDQDGAGWHLERCEGRRKALDRDRKSTRLNSS